MSLNSSADSILPNVNFFDISFFSLQILTVTRLFGFVFATTLGRFLIVLIFSPSNSKIISPDFIPPLSAGPFCETPPIKAPDLGSSKPATDAISFVTS